MNFTEEDVVLAKERILAVQEILNDLSKMFDLAEVETKEVKAQVKETKKEEPKKEQPKEENDLSEVIQEYDLEEMTEEELKEYLTDYDIKFPVKAKKQKLMELVAQAIVDGVIATGGDSEEEELADPLAEDDASEMSKREEEEEKILADIEQQVADKKLTKKKAQEWLKELYANHDTCKNCPKNCNEDPIECYKLVQTSFVDDEGEVHDTCEGYIRDGVAFCCGVECEEFEGDKVVCTVCGEVYDMGEDD